MRYDNKNILLLAKCEKEFGGMCKIIFDYL